MDWTEVYTESGEEEFILSARRIKASRSSRLISSMYHYHSNESNHNIIPSRRSSNILEEEYGSHRLFNLGVPSFESDSESRSIHHTYSQDDEAAGYSSYTLGALYCLTINYVLGVGCLGVPYAFARAGFILCGTILVLVTVLSFCTVMWISEAGPRAEVEVRYVNRGNGYVMPIVGKDTKDGEEKNIFRTSSNVAGSTLTEESRLLKGKVEYSNGITKHAPEESFDPDQYEVIDLVSYFLGPFHATLYQMALLALMYVGLLAYSQVFCGAISALMPIAEHDSRSWINILPQLIFGSMVVPLSCLELDEQISIQFAMAIVRFLSIFIMIGGKSVSSKHYQPINYLFYQSFVDFVSFGLFWYFLLFYFLFVSSL